MNQKECKFSILIHRPSAVVGDVQDQLAWMFMRSYESDFQLISQLHRQRFDFSFQSTDELDISFDDSKYTN